MSSLNQENSPEALSAVGEYITLYRDRIRNAYEQVNREIFAPYVNGDIFDMTVSFTMKGILEEEYAHEVFDEERYMNRIREFLEQMRAMSVITGESNPEGRTE